MKKIGITHRVNIEQSYSETRDALDQRWAPLLESLGFCPVLIPNCLTNPIKFIETFKVDGVIFSGGNSLHSYDNNDQSSLNRDATETEILNYCISHNIPVIGICRGLQFIVDYFGGTLSKIDGHTACYHTVKINSKSEPIKTLKVNSYHTFGIVHKTLPESLEALAWDDDGYVEMLSHREHPIIGILWHPERETQISSFDLNIIKRSFNET